MTLHFALSESDHCVFAAGDRVGWYTYHEGAGIAILYVVAITCHKPYLSRRCYA